MSEKRFECVFNVVELLNEQQATISRLEEENEQLKDARKIKQD